MVLRGGPRGRVGRRRTCLKRVVPTAVVERPSSLVWVLLKAGGWLAWRMDPERRRVGRQVAAARAAGSLARGRRALARPAERAGRRATPGASRPPVARTREPVVAMPPGRVKDPNALPVHPPKAPAAAAARAAHPRAPRCAAIPARELAKARVGPHGRLARHGKAQRLAGRAPAPPAMPRERPPKMTSGAAGPTRPTGPGNPRRLVGPALRRGLPPASSAAARGRPRVTEAGQLRTAAIRGARPGPAAPSATVRRPRTDLGQPAVLRRPDPVGAPKAAAHATGRPSATSGAMTELRLPATVLAGQRVKTARQPPPGRTAPKAAATGEMPTPRAPGPVQVDQAQTARALAGRVQIGRVPTVRAPAIVARLVAEARDRIPPLAGPPVDPARTVRRAGRLAAGPGKAPARVMPAVTGAVTAGPGRAVTARATGRRNAPPADSRGREVVLEARLPAIGPGSPVRRCPIRSAPTNSIPTNVPS